MSTTGFFEEPLLSSPEGFHWRIQDGAEGDMPPVVIDRTEDGIPLSSRSPTLSSLLSDLAEIIAGKWHEPNDSRSLGDHSSSAPSDDPQELVSSNENPMHQALVFREAHEMDRIFGDALSRDRPLSNCLHEEAIMDSMDYPSTNTESICALGCTMCSLSTEALYLVEFSHEVDTSNLEQRSHDLGIDAVYPLLLDTASQVSLEDRLALNAPFETEFNGHSDVPVTSVDTGKAEVVHVDPRDSVEKGRAKPGARARRRKREIVPSLKENKDDGKENVPEIHEEPTEDSLRWIRDLPPMKSPLVNTKRSQAKKDRAKPDERPSTPLPNDKVEWMEKIMETAYCDVVPPKPYKPKRN